MSATSEAERSLKDGDPARALSLLQEEVRGNPSSPKLRIFLFQLLSVLGQWDRAMTQLSLAAELDPSALAMAQTYRDALQCEALRTQVFEGRKTPLILGQPEPWVAYLIEALSAFAAGDKAQARGLRSNALEQAPATSGTVDGQAFQWIADADMRLGPVLEAIVNGRYYWVPFDRISRIAFEAPTDLRDIVWMPANIALTNGGETVALIPARYAGSESSADSAIVMSRKTIWEEPDPGLFCGLGQRVLATDEGERPLLDIRDLRMNEPTPAL